MSYRSTPSQRRAFGHDLLTWFAAHAREMPWRKTKDPYRIWLSETMLQQTRVDQATPYYHRFLEAFPTVTDLAHADLDTVLRLWEGLGYYSRARNLHKAAQMIVDDFGGRFPDTPETLRALPGVGPYTTAAVGSIAFNHPLAVLDGNVMRVLTRVWAISDDIKSSKTKKNLQTLANTLLPPEQPGPFNEAVMELGATVCTPRQPKCTICPLQAVCRAFAQGTPTAFPVATKKKPIPHYDIAVGMVFDDQDQVLITRRPEEGLLGGLWEFPGGKQEPGEALAETCARELHEELGITVDVGDLVDRVNHAYTHFKITLHAFKCRLKSGTPVSYSGNPVRWVPLSALTDYAFPRANRRLIENLQQRQGTPTLFD